MEEIKQLIGKELQDFEGKFADAVKSHVPLLDRIMHYIVKRKRQADQAHVRPAVRPFILQTALTKIPTAPPRLWNFYTPPPSYTTMWWTTPSERRGFFSVNALWKNKIAVLVGDYLLSKGLLLSASTTRISAAWRSSPKP